MKTISSQILLPRLFDQSLRTQRLRNYDEEADFLSYHSAQSLRERLSFIKRKFNKSCIINNGPHFADSILLETNVIQIDFMAQSDLSNSLIFSEHLDFEPASFDLLIYNLNLHWVSDLPGLLCQIRHILKPDGVFLASLLGGDTLKELKDCFLQAEIEIYGGASARVIPMIELHTASQLLLRAGFSIPVADREKLTVTYDCLESLMRDLRRLGQTNIMYSRSKKTMTRHFFNRVEEIYKEKYSSDDNRIQATFEIIYLTGWAPHQSQQKALKPGSAKLSLIKALD